MSLLKVAKWELRSTLRSRKFLFIFLFQIAVLILTLFMFSGFTNIVEKGESLTPSKWICRARCH